MRLLFSKDEQRGDYRHSSDDLQAIRKAFRALLGMLLREQHSHYPGTWLINSVF